jgi:hypothetical protein
MNKRKVPRPKPKKGDLVRFIEDRWICAGEYTYMTTSEFEVTANDIGMVLDVIEYKEPNLAAWMTVLVNGQLGHLTVRKPWPVRVIS